MDPKEARKYEDSWLSWDYLMILASIDINTLLQEVVTFTNC